MNIKRVKYIAAFLLLICLALPMSKCAKPVPPTPPGEITVQYKDSIEYDYLIPIAEIEIKDASTYVTLLPFIWPFPFWSLKSKYDKKWNIKIFHIAEFFLLFYSWGAITGNLFLWEIAWGGYIAISAVSILSIFYIYQVVIDLKSKNKTKTNLKSKST